MDGVTRPRRFGPDRRITALSGAGALIALIGVVVTSDSLARVLWGLAAVLLVGYAIGDLVWSTRLIAAPVGLRIRTPFTRCDLAWSEVDAVRADIRSRYGLRTTTLEVDADAVLVVFSRRTLGADPEQVAEVVNALRPPV